MPTCAFVLLFTILCFCIKLSDSVIYKLNDSEYDRMPPIYIEDERDGCSQYCAVKLQVFQDRPSALYNMILDYSEFSVKHFNHTQLWYGVCMSKSCPKYIANTTVDLKLDLEACLNESMLRDYDLQAKVTWHRCDSDIKPYIDFGDILVAGVCLVFVLLTAAGTVLDLYIYFFNKKKKGNDILECFSLPRNVISLFSSGTVITEETRNFKVFYGIRLILILLVIGFHTFLPFFLKTDDAHIVEDSYSVLKYFCNGTVMVQPLFVLSGFLLSYSVFSYGHTHKLTPLTIARGIFLRWIRLTPSFAIVLGIVSTWMRFLELLAGPTWQWSMGAITEDCRRDWWLVLLHLVNYVDNSRCLPETWYVSSDMQLTIIALVVLVLTRGWCRNLVLAALFIASSAAVVITTITLDLDATVIIKPETVRNYIIVDPTFTHIYKRMHTNMPTYIIGVVTGILVYRLQNSTVKMEEYKKYGFVVLLCFLVGAPVIFVGAVLYEDGPRISLMVRVLWAATHKVIIAILTGVVFVGLVFKLEDVLRKIFGWRMWVLLARVSYCAYLVHVSVASTVAAFSSALHFTVKDVFPIILLVEVISFTIAVPLWLVVEAPISKLVRLAIKRFGWDGAVSKEKTARELP